MKILILLLVSVLFIPAYADARGKVEKFLSGLDGEFALLKSESAEKCPSWVAIKTGEKSVKVFNMDKQDYKWNFKDFDRINKRRQRHGDDMFTYTDERHKLVGTEVGPAVLNQTRPCSGVVFVSCAKWHWNWGLTKLDQDNLTLSVNQSAHQWDGSGFPAGECNYIRKE